MSKPWFDTKDAAERVDGFPKMKLGEIRNIEVTHNETGVRHIVYVLLSGKQSYRFFNSYKAANKQRVLRALPEVSLLDPPDSMNAPGNTGIFYMIKFPLSEKDKARCLKYVEQVKEEFPRLKPTPGEVWQLYRKVGNGLLETVELLPVFVLNTNDGQFRFFDSEKRAKAMALFFI